ncbi:nuclear transport factor 2 family protein [Gammaproteobacteria bacterium]|jgi:steroid delta-isomerase|nr:nuclear transport factor 2 family protein [Gammaproteobacteria bacterium]
MKEKVQLALDNYVLAYSTNDKKLFSSLWDDEAVFEDPVGAEPCKGIEAICAFWDFGHVDGMEITPSNIETVICANEGILKAVMEVRNTNDNSGMNISIVDHFVVNEAGKIISGRAFWDESSIAQPSKVKSMDINVDDFKDRG